VSEKYTWTQIEDYLQRLYDDDDPVRHEMEILASQRKFPIIGPVAGRHLFQLARMVQAKRIFELGSGYGYSALWFARAVGLDGEVHCTELSSKNIELAEDFLTRAGVWHSVTYYQEEATEALKRVGGVWDIVYNDIDKEGYPATIELAYDQVRPGGLFITDNLIWHGRIFETEKSASTQAVVEFTGNLLAHPGFVTTIYPVRDGLAVALRL
jgi:predicted O-methyltransferase YrrM